MQLLSGRRGIKRLLYVILPGACLVMPNQRLKAKGECGGWGGIRTHGEREPTAVFKTAALNHSATHPARSEEHTSELQSLMRISYAVSCLKKKIHTQFNT